MKEVIQYSFLLGVSLLGQAIHIMIKMNAMQRRSNAAGIPYRSAEIFEKDWTNMCLSFLCNIGLLAVFSEISTYVELVKTWPKCLFLLSGYTGSSLVLGALSKADKAQRQAIEEFTNSIINNKMEYIWELPYWNEDDLFQHESSSFTPAVFAQVTFGIIDTGAKTITYESEPAFSEVTIWLNGNSSTTQIAAPIRKPK
jgi:hypothetical protein